MVVHPIPPKQDFFEKKFCGIEDFEKKMTPYTCGKLKKIYTIFPFSDCHCEHAW